MRKTGPRTTTHMTGVGAFRDPSEEELKRANDSMIVTMKKQAELRRNPPEFKFDWRKFV